MVTAHTLTKFGRASSAINVVWITCRCHHFITTYEHLTQFAVVNFVVVVYFVVWICLVLFSFIEMSFLSDHKWFFFLLAKSNQMTKWSNIRLTFCRFAYEKIRLIWMSEKTKPMRRDEIYVILLHMSERATDLACVRTHVLLTFCIWKIVILCHCVIAVKWNEM